MADVLLFYKHFAKYVPGLSHIGLGNNALFSARVLKKYGVKAVPLGVHTADHIREFARKYPEATHAVVEGTWIKPVDLEAIAAEFPRVEWTCREHSQLSFLVAQGVATEYARGYGAVADRSLNFVFSANSERFCRAWVEAYSQPCPFIPNLYPLDAHPAGPRRRRGEHRDTLRISSFGAQRVFKNHPTGVAAAMMIGRRLGRDVEVHVNVGREPGLDRVTKAIRDLTSGVPGVRLVEHSWTAWGEFRHWCAAMDLGMATTFTETFCLTAADHISAGVPVVGTNAIEWLPRHWMCEADNPEDAARVGCSLLLDPFAAEDGRTALERNQADAVRRWMAWLGRPAPCV